MIAPAREEARRPPIRGRVAVQLCLGQYRGGGLLAVQVAGGGAGGAAEVTDRFGWLVSYAAMHLSRELVTKVRPMVSHAQLRDPARYLQEKVADLAATGAVVGVA